MIGDKEKVQLRSLDSNALNILELLAVGDKAYSRQDIHALAGKAGWRGESGRKLASKEVSDIVNTLLEGGFLEHGSYRGVRIDEDFQDIVVQGAVLNGRLTALADIVKGSASASPWSYRDHQPRRDQRIAFYSGDSATFLKNVSKRNDCGFLGLFRPFSRDIFDGLPDDLKQWYLVDALPLTIMFCDDGPEIIAAFEDMVEERGTAQSVGSLATWLDLAIAQGSLESLRFLDALTGGKHPEVGGCIALLEGDHNLALNVLGPMMPGGKRRGKLAAGSRLPGLITALVLLSQGSPAALDKVRAIVRAGTKSTGRYIQALEIIGIGAAFKQTPSSAKSFANRLKDRCLSPLETLVVGYLARWLLAGGDTRFQVPHIAEASEKFSDLGLDWFAAEAYELAKKRTSKTAKKKNESSLAARAQLETSSLVDLAVPQPAWRRSLDAIAELAGEEGDVATEASSSVDRIIWELNTAYSGFNLAPFHQTRKGTRWSKGRKVGLARLYDEFEDPAQFGFLSDQDLAICRALNMETSRNYRGYPETSYFFSRQVVAKALVGHPRVYPPGEREKPIEIVEQKPQLRVTRTPDGSILLSIDPKPSNDVDSCQTNAESKHKVALVFFDDQHLKLHKMLGGALKVPADAQQHVVESIQKISPLISVHSEIGDSAAEKERVDADARPHIHLLPHGEGLQAEFYVYPFGVSGPSYRPGSGGENVFAGVDGKSKSCVRDLAEENRLRDEVIGACPVLAAHAENETSMCLPAPAEALEVLVEVEDLVDAEKATLHWPRGKSMVLAGRAAPDSLWLHIRKDRDMFAASGSLSVNSESSLDLMRLIDLVEASPCRFVKLDDGRFLALTEELRRRIEELALYGDRQSKQNKLRFPPVRATVLEPLDGAVKLKSDKHWKEWVDRIRGVGDIQADVPSTFQAELRDYQREGFCWLTRLATWGVGACLADDMGLGKTIQALALLLNRAKAGPSLVVAPASVAHNWIAEARRFAPTLNVRLFGDGDRAEHLDGLGSFDVAICTYGLLNTEATRLGKTPWNTVILDEAQLIKNETTLRSQAAKGLRADFRLIMTGTPLENHLGELWNLFDFINPGLLGSSKNFVERFVRPIETGRCEKTRRSLKRLIQPFILRRTKSQVLEELPPRTEIVRKVTLGREEAALYEALRGRAIEKLRETGGQGGPQHLKILAEIMRLRRACCHPRLVLPDSGIGSAKLSLFCETIDELLAGNHKVLVFSQFVDHLTILKEELERERISYQYLDGSTPIRQRKESIEAFQAGQGDVFLISLRAGGLGLNLTAADYVIHMDPWWNPAVEDQASDRAHRLGQKRPVTIYRFITQGTVEEKIAALHAKKRALADSLLEGADMSGKLSADELLDLIRE